MLAQEFPSSLHVRDLGMERAGDVAIWEFARDNDYTIVSKDSDFHQRSFLYGRPPKVVWVRLGNVSTDPDAFALDVQMPVDQVGHGMDDPVRTAAG